MNCSMLTVNDFIVLLFCAVPILWIIFGIIYKVIEFVDWLNGPPNFRIVWDGVLYSSDNSIYLYCRHDYYHFRLKDRPVYFKIWWNTEFPYRDGEHWSLELIDIKTARLDCTNMSPINESLVNKDLQ